MQHGTEPLALPLLVPGICANYINDATTAHDLTVFTDALNTRANFHLRNSPSAAIQIESTQVYGYLPI